MHDATTGCVYVYIYPLPRCAGFYCLCTLYRDSPAMVTGFSRLLDSIRPIVFEA